MFFKFIMKKTYYYIALILISRIFNTDAQNLIPNSGFDSLTKCPDELAQIEFASPWVSCALTPDLYNSCSNNPELKVPYAGRHIDSYQPPRSGSGYAGISVYGEANVKSKELLGVPLIQHLKKNKLYYIKFYVSPDLTPSMLYWRYLDAIALAFTDSVYYIEVEPDPEFRIPLEPAIENRGTLIKDTMGWTKIEGCYLANGTKNFAVIGNFRPNSEVRFEKEWKDIYGSGTYFYIEDVLVMEFDPLPDTVLLCNENKVKLNAGFLDAKYLWNTGSRDSILEINNAGIFTVDVIMDSCTMSDTVVVIDMREIESYATMDTTICSDETLILNSPLYGKYKWSTSDNDTLPFLVVDNAGNYKLTVTNDCGEYIRDISVDIKECDCKINIPNIFTPNGDGINDILSGKMECDFEFDMKIFRIYDRWGNKIYEVDDFKKIKWDGTFRGKYVMNGVYVWSMEYSVVRNKKIEQKYLTGDVTILR